MKNANTNSTVKKSSRRPIKEAPVTLESFRKKWGIKITTEMAGKMAGMWSISTSCLSNPFCVARMKRGDAVCKDCYAKRLMEFRKNLQPCYDRNYEALNNNLIPVEEWPRINVNLFRIEAYGDIGSVTHARNYLRFIKRNPHVQFAWWTKNPNLIETAMRLEEFRPTNCQFVGSSLKVNQPETFIRWEWINKVFTVYDRDDGCINCGANNCFECRKCYENNGIREMRELLKLTKKQEA